MAAGASLGLRCAAAALLKDRFQVTQELGRSTAERAGSSRSRLEHLPPLGGSDCLGLSLASYSQDFHMGLHLNLKTCGLIFQSTKKSTFLLPSVALARSSVLCMTTTQPDSDFEQPCEDRSVAVTRRPPLLMFQRHSAPTWRLCLCSS